MEPYDIVMLVVIAGAGIFGAVKGFAWQVASIASIVASYFVAYRYREPLSRSIVAEPPWNQFLAMLILFVGTSLVIWVAFNMVKKTIDQMKLKEFDRQIGALFGLVKGALYCALITLFAVTLMGDETREKIVASKSGRFIARNLGRSESVIPPEIHQYLQPYLERFDKEFEEAQSGAQQGGFGQSAAWNVDASTGQQTRWESPPAAAPAQQGNGVAAPGLPALPNATAARPSGWR